MRQAAEAVFSDWEPLLDDVIQAMSVGQVAHSHGLRPRSIFVAGPLHDPAQSEVEISRIVAIAKAAARFGCAQVADYPAALRGGQTTDADLIWQARTL